MNFTKRFLLLALALILPFAFASCSSDSDEDTQSGINSEELQTQGDETQTVATYTVTFNTNGGNQIESQTVESGKTAAEPNTPAKDGFTFSAWYSDESLESVFSFSTPITKDMTLWAKWIDASVPTYTVAFDTDGGSAVQSQTVASGDTAAKPSDPTKNGFVFLGWYADSAFAAEYDFSSAITADTTIYARWQTATYTVTFNTNGGSEIESQTVEHGKTAAKPVSPTKSAKGFGGWYSDSDLTQEFDFGTAITADTTLYAKWCDGMTVKEAAEYIRAMTQSETLYIIDMENWDEDTLQPALSALAKKSNSVTISLDLTATTKLTRIGNQSFYNAASLVSIVLPTSVTYIDICAFENCTSLVSISIPPSVTHIEKEAFLYCTSLKEINFGGTVEQWNSVADASDADWNKESSITVVHCTDGDVAL